MSLLYVLWNSICTVCLTRKHKLFFIDCFCLYSPNPLTVVDEIADAQDPGSSYQARIEWSNGHHNPQNFPEIEVMRDATVNNIRKDVPFWPNEMDDQLEPDTVLMELMKEKGTPTITMEMVSGGPSRRIEQVEETVSAVSEQNPGIFDSNNAFGRIKVLVLNNVHVIDVFCLLMYWLY